MQSGVDLPKTGIGQVEHHDPFSRLEDMYVVGLVRLHVMFSIEPHAGSCNDSTPLGTVYLSIRGCAAHCLPAIKPGGSSSRAICVWRAPCYACTATQLAGLEPARVAIEVQ